ncbi:GGDEF domain-containing protein [Parasphingorhabdus halotolerans]|uniref:diguanylate cyclase n=1 Tax=Parasphingorhabdus halotolerans TaxID=2725558 RepID=A0A6H2DKG5_9SPHN|nr:GGDEF domain-containing protein [Parasphingorhabdus halotolerans]QJB68688.1 GGDEF domain-containing protein [Parasphingorhabdus halotolerans]
MAMALEQKSDRHRMVSDSEVSRQLLRDGLERRVAGQLSVMVPVGVIAWLADNLPNTSTIWLLLGLQCIAQGAIAVTSQRLRKVLESKPFPRIRHNLWMFAEAAAGAIWAIILLYIGPIIGSSDAALTAWITILVSMTVSVLLAAPIAGIAFPLLGGFAAAVVTCALALGFPLSNFSSPALTFMIAGLFVIIKAINLQAHKSCRAQIEVVRLSERLEQELDRTSWLSRHDSLTGLLNSAAMKEHIATLAGRQIAVMLLDIDKFKAINDQFGHDRGDSVLHAVGHCLSETLANAAPEAIAARWGGEEFLVAIPQSTAIQPAAIAEQLRLAIAKLRDENWPTELTVTASFGVASGTAQAFSDLFKCADAAMYVAKAQGRNRVVCADSDTGADAGAEPIARVA